MEFLASLNLLSAILLGLLGAGHCMAMCGGIIASLSMSLDVDGNTTQLGARIGRPKAKRHWPKLVGYQLGRIISYTVFGLLAGWLGYGIQGASPLPILKLLSASLLIAMGLYISRLWMGLSVLEKGGKYLWKYVSPLSRFVLPVRSPAQAFALGTLWGWLPCGLVYTALGYALALGDALSAALFMLAFGIGTLPSTLSLGALGGQLKQLLNRPTVRGVSALIFVLFGLWNLYALYSGTPHHHPH